MSSAKSFHETFYGTPTEDESRRRRGKKRHNKAAKEEPQNEVAVIGVHYRSFDDDSLAAFVNSATALVPWNGDPKLLIDRYDVRHLLQDLTGIRRRRARPPSPDATKEELDYERYRDVEGLENPSPPEDELRNEDVTGGGYQRVGFDYGTSGDQETRKERVEDALFSAPFFVPEHLRLQIPTSTKVHQIMAGTAKYVIEHGGQAEIVLRVKQANNPTFGFLMPDHHDHEYFRFLVAHPEHVGIGPTSQQAAVAEVAAPVSSEEAEGGLSLLGTAYGDADEDEEEGEGSEAYKDQAEELLVVATGDLEEVGTVTKLHIEGSSDHGAARKKSSTINLTTSDVAENATKDRGDSLEVSLGSDVPKSVLQSGEGPVDGLVDSSPGSGDQVPQGREACSSGSGEMEGHEGQGYSGDLDHQVVPPYKEPPLRLRLIINKMVEFISRNGKEFEAIVKERDKADHRFPFFLPWNEYHPYYAKELESARQARLSAETDSTGIPSTIDPLNPLQVQEAAEKDEGTESFLNGVPVWDTSQAVESNCVNGEEVSNMPEYEEEKSHNDEGGMGFDAVLAAVRFATRGRLQPVDGNHESDLLKISDGDERPGIGSDEAVLAAIRAATGRTKLDSSGSVGKKDVPNVAGSNAPDVKEARDPAQTSTVSRGAALGDTKDPIQTSTLSRNTSVGDSSDPIGTATSLPQSTAEAIINLDEDHVVVPHLVTKAGVLSPVEERDSVEPQLTTPEKRKAERLKKAKLFAAMIKDKKGSLTNPVQLSGSVGISAPNLDRLNQVFVALESTTGNVAAASIDAEPETRDQTGDTQVQVATEADKELVDSPVKQRKHKAKSKEEEERRRKHRHKRRKDMEEGGNGRVHSPGTGERREDKHHDHYQDGKRKESKYGPEAEGRGKDNKRGLSEGKPRVDEGFQDLEDRTEEYEEARKDRVHYTKDSERRKESRYGYEAEQKKRRDRHTQGYEGTRKESRHERDAEDERREDRQKHDKSRHGYASEDERRVDRHTHNKTRHGYDSEEGRREDRKKHDISRHGYDSEEGRREDRKKHDISRHEYDSEEERRGDRQKPDKIRRGYDFEEERRGDRQKEDTDRKRKDRSRHDSEEKRSGDRYEYDSDGMRKGRSHRQGKRKKHSDRTDVSDDKDGRNDYRTKKSRQDTDDFESATLATHVERQSTHLREVKDDRKLGVVSPVKQDVPPQTNVSQMRVGEEKSTLSSADVPDDIRAKVRAMLAMM